jgi:hypothetical protein
MAQMCDLLVSIAWVSSWAITLGVTNPTVSGAFTPGVEPMNATKRTAVMQNVQQIFAARKFGPAPNMEKLSGRELRKWARELGILRRRVKFTPLTPESRAIVWAVAREEYKAWTLKTQPAR